MMTAAAGLAGSYWLSSRGAGAAPATEVPAAEARPADTQSPMQTDPTPKVFGPRIAAVREGVLAWLEAIRWKGGGGGEEARGLWGRWPYHAQMQRPYAVISSANAIRILDDFDALSAVPATHKREAIAYLQSCQDAGDGHFKDPLVSNGDRLNFHSWLQIWGQMGTAQSALSILGAAPLFERPRVMHHDPGEIGGAEFTRRFDWSDPWKVGEGWTRGIRARLSNVAHGEVPADVREAMATYEAEILDARTGLPILHMKSRDRTAQVIAMCGLFKTMGAYLSTKTPVPHAQTAIDTTLALQLPDGSFGPPLTQNWDALWVLRELDLQLKGAHRHADIVAAGDRCCDLLLREYRKPDGGFSFNRDGCMDVHHSVRLSAQRYPISDTHGTRMSLQCLAYVDEWQSQP